jgi:hypothetical protein
MLPALEISFTLWGMIACAAIGLIPINHFRGRAAHVRGIHVDAGSVLLMQEASWTVDAYC